MSNINVKKSIAIFDNEPVRRVWLEKEEKWVFSVVDIIGILTESKDARTYWKVLKHRLITEGSNQTVTNCNQLKLIASECYASRFFIRISNFIDDSFRNRTFNIFVDRGI